MHLFSRRQNRRIKQGMTAPKSKKSKSRARKKLHKTVWVVSGTVATTFLTTFAPNIDALGTFIIRLQ